MDPCLRNGLPAAYRATSHRSGEHLLPTDDSTGTTAHALDADHNPHGPKSITDFLSSAPPLSGSTTLCSPQIGFGSFGRKWASVTGGGRTKGSEGKEMDKGAGIGGLGDSRCLTEDMEKMSAEGEGKVGFADDTDSGEKQLGGQQGLAVLIGPNTVPAIPIRPTPIGRQDSPPPQVFATSFTPGPSPPTTTSTAPNNLAAPPAASPRDQTPAQQPNWIQPLATAVLASTEPTLGPRRSSDPALGHRDRSRRELRLAAEKLYTDAQAQL